MKNITHFSSRLIGAFFPNHCRVCQGQLTAPAPIAGNFLCQYCYESLPWNKMACLKCALPLMEGQLCGTCLMDPLSLNVCLSPLIYKPPISNFIAQLKFQQQLWCGKVLGLILASAIHQHYQNQPLPEAIIPIPLHTRRLRQRGFNQSVEIAKPIAQQLKIPIILSDFYRHKYTQAQSQLPAAQRNKNISGAFSSRRVRSMKYVAIVDDVITTGQTIREFSKILHKQKVSKIDIWSCARVI